MAGDGAAWPLSTSKTALPSTAARACITETNSAPKAWNVSSVGCLHTLSCSHWVLVRGYHSGRITSGPSESILWLPLCPSSLEIFTRRMCSPGCAPGLIFQVTGKEERAPFKGKDARALVGNRLLVPFQNSS